MKYISALLRRSVALIKLSLIKLMHYNYFNFKPIEIVSNSTKFTFRNKGKIELGSNIGTRKNVEFSTDGGTIQIGEGCFFNNNCMIVSHDKIIIGKKCSFGPNVMFFDHDHDFRVEGGIHSKKFKKNAIVIGNNVWIGANCVILRGTIIGDNCVVAAGSVIKGKYPKNKIIMQKRQTTLYEFNAKLCLKEGSDKSDKNITNN